MSAPLAPGVLESVGFTVVPLVPSWDHPHGYPRWFDNTGTTDQSPWMAIPAALEHWTALGGWDAVAASVARLDDGVRLVAEALGQPGQVSSRHCPLMRLVRLPDGRVTDAADADRYYEELSAQGVEAAVIHFGGATFVRVAGSTPTTAEDFHALAEALARPRRPVTDLRDHRA